MRTAALNRRMKSVGRASFGPWPGLIALAAMLMTACSGTSSSASHPPSAPAATGTPSTSAAASPSAAPSPSPAATPRAAVGPYGVLVTPLSGPNYTVSIIGVDGRVVASGQVTSPPQVSCGNTAAAVVPPPVSTSDFSVFFMNAQGAVTGLNPQLGLAAMPLDTVPISTATRRTMFAVSPDESRIAVVVADFSATGASTRLYVEDAGGGNHVDLFTESGSYTLWPIGWHGTNNLVVAKVPACTQGGGPLCCGPQELHVVDPATAIRRFTLGGPQCVVAGSPSSAGVVCEATTTFTQATVLSWTDVNKRTLAIKGPTPAYLSPDGALVAIVDFGSGTTIVNGLNRTLPMQACGWIDANHLLAGGDTQSQPRVGDVTTGTVVPVNAQGECGGTIPGGL